ncbi:MAG: cation:proton antiporter [Clostridia bacterium]|nr:cation:proton antiporter [Clostridia bacterium]
MEHAYIMINLALALGAGLTMSRFVKLIGLPAVTGYLIAGILIGPYCLGRLGIEGFGLISYENVTSYSIISETALGFIAFTIGNEFRLADLKKVGKQAVIVSIFEALSAVIVVDAVLISVHFIVGEEVFPLSAAITLGAIAAATAPAATLMVVRQYKAKGPVTSILLPVVALDDAIGLIAFAISFGVAKSLTGSVNAVTLLVEPILEIVLSLAGGALLGWLFTLSERFFYSRSKRLAVSVTFVFLTIALSMLEFEVCGVKIGFSSLLACMMLGTVFCNTCDFSFELMDRVDRWTAPLFVLFFVLSGAELQFNVFFDVRILIIGLLYIVFRCVGKQIGASTGSLVMKCEPQVTKYLGVTLFPQAGVALGMSLNALSVFPPFEGQIIRNIVLFGVLVYELVGPLLTKIALTKAGEITAEERASARVKNAK